MRQTIDLAVLYARAVRRVQSRTLDGQGAAPLPATCPFTLDDLLADTVDVPALLTQFGAAAKPG